MLFTWGGESKSNLKCLMSVLDEKSVPLPSTHVDLGLKNYVPSLSSSLEQAQMSTNQIVANVRNMKTSIIRFVKSSLIFFLFPGARSTSGGRPSRSRPPPTWSQSSCWYWACTPVCRCRSTRPWSSALSSPWPTWSWWWSRTCSRGRRRRKGAVDQSNCPSQHLRWPKR